MKLHFQTSINCSNCLRKVTPLLNSVEGISHWEVRTDLPEKILTVEGDLLSPEFIISQLDEIGFEARLLPDTKE